MLCLVCGCEFLIRRTLVSLFSFKEYFCCDKCLARYPFKINYSHIPLDNHELIIVSIFEKDHKVNYDGFILEYSQIYYRLKEVIKTMLMVMYDRVYLSSDFIKKYTHISTLLDKDIYILTNVLII